MEVTAPTARPPFGLPPETRRVRLTAAAIGARLAPLYAPVLREPVPDEWIRLLGGGPADAMRRETE